ncbi:MAG: hypothetical protein IPG57_08590 [Burkholderiales bacterium]|nr:hypothetical protein [Burkholderiales bacterium]
MTQLRPKVGDFKRIAAVDNPRRSKAWPLPATLVEHQSGGHSQPRA